MPLPLTLVERLLFQTTAKAPGPMVDMVGLLGFHATAAAIELGLFEALRDGPLEDKVLAERIAASERGLRYLVDAVLPLGYLAREGDRLRLTPQSERWLLKGARQSVADLYLYFADMAGRWSRLPESVRLGRPAMPADRWYADHPEAWARYHAGMRSIARLLSDEVLARVPLSDGDRRLLDLGGSHGLYSARFCERYPQLSATVLDMAAARPVAEETLAAEGMGGRVAFREGDIHRDDLGTGWDVVLLFNVARISPEAELRPLLARIAAALAEGGRLIVLDQLADRLSTRFRQANARMIDLEIFNSTPGDIHPLPSLSRWIAEAGMAEPRHIPLRRSGGQGLLVARKR